jgi:hypothetical protein
MKIYKMLRKYTRMRMLGTVTWGFDDAEIRAEMEGQSRDVMCRSRKII